MNIIGHSTHVLDLGVSMSSNCRFYFHISNLYKRCPNLADWILRIFIMRDCQRLISWACLTSNHIYDDVPSIGYKIQIFVSVLPFGIEPIDFFKLFI